MQQLLIVTHNPEKFGEIAQILKQAQLPCRLKSMADFPDLQPVEEDAPTIEGNAAKKALSAAKATGLLAVADDTGLFIDALNGAPGVYSARWASPDCSYLANRLKALDLLKGEANRKASFETAVALAAPDGIIGFGRGCVEGRITHEERGHNGFGYDSIFEEISTGLSYAQMDEDTKNSLSHRALAFQDILPLLRQILK